MKKKIFIISSCILLIIIISSFIYYCNVYDKNLVNPNDIVTDSKFENATFNQVGDSTTFKEGILGRITIEKIRIKCRSKRGEQ